MKKQYQTNKLNRNNITIQIIITFNQYINGIRHLHKKYKDLVFSINRILHSYGHFCIYLQVLLMHLLKIQIDEVKLTIYNQHKVNIVIMQFNVSNMNEVYLTRAELHTNRSIKARYIS